MLAAARAVGATGVERFAHGTTVATNALLERRGARTAFVANEGFEHCCTSGGRRARTSIGCARASGAARAARALPRRARGASARTASSRRSTRRCRTLGDVEAVAVCLLFSFRDPRTSARSATSCARRHQACTSSRRTRWRRSSGSTSARRRRPRTRISRPSRRATCGRSPSARASAGLPEPLVMLSSGGVATIGEAAAHPAAILVSGPAGGVVGAGLVARRAGFEHAIAFDMGGTSTDVCLLPGGRAARVAERTVGGFPIRLPTVDLHTVGAGGGSLVRRDAGGAIRVGPGVGGRPSRGRRATGAAAARPSPTRISCSGGCRPSFRAGSCSTATRRSARSPASTRRPSSTSSTPRCCARCASSPSSGATIRATSRSSRSAAPGRCTRARSPRSSGSRRCSSRQAAGVLSALGLVASDERRDRVVSYVCPLADAGELPPEGEADLRYRGQSFELTVPLQARARRGIPPRARGAVRLRRREPRDRARGRAHRRGHARARRLVPCDGRSTVAGPALLELPGSTCWVPDGLERRDERRRHAGAARVDVELQVIGSALRAVAEEMGAVLIRSAFSANIKERRDCSTAVFDERGRMVAQAEHIPVHLGAMPDAVAAAIELGLDAGRDVHPQRPVHRRHAPARRDAGLAHRARVMPCRARTTPTSAAWSLRGCPRSRASSTRRD